MEPSDWVPFGGRAALGRRLQPAPVLQSNTGLALRIGRQGPAVTKEPSLGAPRWCASAYPVYPHAHASASASASASTLAPARRCGGFVAKVRPAELWNPATEEQDRRLLAGPKRGSSWVGSRVRLRAARGGDVQPDDSSRYYRQLHAKHRLEVAAAAGRAWGEVRQLRPCGGMCGWSGWGRTYRGCIPTCPSSARSRGP